MRISNTRSLVTACTVALVLAATAARAQEAPRTATIDMVGQASVSAAPDMAMVQSGVVSDAETAGDAMTANTAAMSAVVARIKAAGIEPRDIQTSGFSVSPRYRRLKSTGPDEYRSEVFGYRVTNNVTVRVRELANLGALLDAMVRDGANQIGGISFVVSDADSLKDAARKAAMTDAMRKAKLYADAAGVELGRVLSINEQDFGGPRPQMMMARAEMVSDSAPAPVEAGETSLQVRVNVTWELAQ
ncbi:SIMPL domain-containing protein [Stappia sp. ES.058]|uniref:SIMPL domain-containing protein n=1 Tax=Stappia sp. ES.058 TaxID=1881061 RepID=UPI0008798B44|nr:SIMPL domain-containing protein [Stappia sp. ES.058]SDU27891.1 hypothetical protein SAMN05428979_2705 [Stappia sp. ES.058]